MVNPHEVTRQFELELSRYTGAPYVVCVDNCSNAIKLSLMYEKEFGDWPDEISIPSRTYMSVPCEIINVGCKVDFVPVFGETITGAYRLSPTRVIDSALRFTADMYRQDTFMCISFTGAFKHLKLGKGGAILTDNEDAYEWFKRARNSGRNECSYHVDNFTMLGINCYMMPEVASRGLLLINQFYNQDGTKKENKDLTLPYPDLSKFEIYRR